MAYDSFVDTKNHIGKVCGFISQFIVVLNKRSVEHDRSKLLLPEKPIFDEFTPKLKGSTYGSEEYKQLLAEMKIALDHHYKENRHHPEHFQNGINDMSLTDLIEMLCDWKAATMRHDNGDIFKSLEINTERFGISKQLCGVLLNTILQMGW